MVDEKADPFGMTAARKGKSNYNCNGGCNCNGN
jgi:hypothetical protein